VKGKSKGKWQKANGKSAAGAGIVGKSALWRLTINQRRH